MYLSITEFFYSLDNKVDSYNQFPNLYSEIKNYIEQIYFLEKTPIVLDLILSLFNKKICVDVYSYNSDNFTKIQQYNHIEIFKIDIVNTDKIKNILNKYGYENVKYYTKESCLINLKDIFANNCISFEIYKKIFFRSNILVLHHDFETIFCIEYIEQETVYTYVDPKTGRSYHIDPKNYGKYREPNHIDVNRLNNSKLPKKKYEYLNY